MTRRLLRKVLDYISAEWRLDAPPRQLVTVLYEVANKQLGEPEEKAAIFAERYLDQARDRLEDISAEADRSASPSRFALEGELPDHIQGSSFVSPLDDEVTQRAKERRLQFDEYHEFLKALSWKEFEACCHGILETLGCAAPKLTPSQNDQGIDFFGRLSLRKRLSNESVLPSIDSRLEVWMVGQAKHYQKTQVSTPDLRELVGSVHLAKTQTFANSGRGLEGLNIRTCDPVFYLFFTTGTISRDGSELLERSGMISMDGFQVAAFLADNEVGMVDGCFSRQAASEWLTNSMGTG